MWCRDDFEKGLKAYRKGFGGGILLGLATLLILGKPLYSLPILLGLLLGAIAFRLKIRQLKKQHHD